MERSNNDQVKMNEKQIDKWDSIKLEKQEPKISRRKEVTIIRDKINEMKTKINMKDQGKEELVV
jgi:hypothetical protein